MLTRAFLFCFTVPAAVYVPKSVYDSVWFWILLFLMMVAIIIHHNVKRTHKGNKHAARKLSYQNHGRDGTVIYTDATSSLEFYFEFGGGDCVAIISIPSLTEWEKVTKRNLADRNQIIEFVATQAQHDQVKDGTYVIKETFIELYQKKQ